MANTMEISVPEDVRLALIARAEAKGLSLSEYADRELIGDPGDVTNDMILDYILAQPRIHLEPSSADIIRELRGPLPEDDGARR